MANEDEPQPSPMSLRDESNDENPIDLANFLDEELDEPIGNEEEPAGDETVISE